MTFKDLINDIKKLVGLTLNSIRPGADLIVLEVNTQEKRLILKPQNGRIKTRPLSEIEIIWQQLCQKPAIHVDEVLHGSGSSRNQPETIIANLPYIEWFRYNRKKHLKLLSNPSHPYGTLKQMEEVDAEITRQMLTKLNIYTPISTVIITNEVAEACQSIEQITGLRVTAEHSGVYSFNNEYTEILVVARNNVDSTIFPGSYTVVNSNSIPLKSIPLSIKSQTFYAVTNAGMQLMIKPK